MFELQVLIPLADNDAVSFTAAHHSQFEAEILARFGGLSLYPEPVSGQWFSEGRTFTDKHRVYSIAVASITQGALVAELAAIAKAHYRQEAIYIRYLGQVEIL